jgi:transmembrane sensor
VTQEDRKRIVAQAAEWFVANRDDPDAAQRAAFKAWLRESPLHTDAYSRLMRLASDLQRAVTDPTMSVDALVQEARAASAPVVPSAPAPVVSINERRLPASPAPRPAQRRAWVYFAAAASLGILAVALLWQVPTRPMPQPVPAASVQRFSTQHGQRLEQRLSDGSILELNTDTSVAVRFGSAGRAVTIERGQVIFQVAHDPQRPFQVTAGSAKVVAVGTQFDVYLQGDSTLVTVIEGRVTVRPASGNAGAAGGPTSIPVSAGQQVRVVRGELPSAPSDVDTSRTTAWLHHQIAFDREPLGAVAAEFNRYTTTPIDIETPALRGTIVSGVFNVDDTASFVDFLRTLPGVHVEVTATRIRVFRP